MKMPSLTEHHKIAVSSDPHDEYEKKVFPLDCQPPSFYKILQQNSDDKLLIPQHFIKNFGGVVTQTVLLRDSSGKHWSVKMQIIGTRLAMTSGWQRFISAHNLTSGDWLLFEYLGNYVFKVKAFGLDCCVKKDYIPVKYSSRKKAELPKEAPEPREISSQEFFRVFGKLRDTFEVPKRVARACVVEPPEETILRTEKGDACTVTFQKIAERLVVTSPRLIKFWEMVNVDAGDKCQFKMVFRSDKTVKEIKLVKVFGFVSKSTMVSQD